MSDVEDRIRHELDELAASVQIDPLAPAALVRRVRRARRRRAAVLSTGAAAVVVVLVVSALGLAGGRSAAPVVVAGPDGRRLELSDPGPARFVMEDLPRSPLTPREDASGVWTGEELIIWGGRSSGAVTGDGAAYVPATGTWHLIAASPLSPRTRHMAVWTGREMIVWGGTLRPNGVGGLVDGAAYDPSTDTWRTISDSPPGSDRTSAPAVSVDGRAVFAGGGSSTGSFMDTVLVYDPAADSWSQHTAGGSVVAMTPFDGRVAIATVGAIGRSGLQVESFDPRTGRSAPLPDVPLDPADGLLDSVGLAASDSALFAGATVTDRGGGQSTTVGVLAPGGRDWEGVRTYDTDEFVPGTRVQTSYPPGLTAWTGTWLIGWSYEPTAVAPGTGRSVDPVDPPGSPVPCGAAGVSVWTGDQILQWGGQNCRRIGSSAQVDSGVSIRIEPAD